MKERVISNLIPIYDNVFSDYESGTLVTRIGNLMFVFSADNGSIDCYGLGYENSYELERDVATFMTKKDLNIFSCLSECSDLNFVNGDMKVELIREGTVFTLVIPHINQHGIVQIRPSPVFFEAISEQIGGHIFFSLANQILIKRVKYTDIFLNKSGDVVQDPDQYTIIFNIKDPISSLPTWDKFMLSKRTRVFFRQTNKEFLNTFLSKAYIREICPLKI